MTAAHFLLWPTGPVAYGPVVLREFSDLDVAMVMELSTNPYVPLIGSLPANASQQQAQDYIDRQVAAWRRAWASRSPSPRRTLITQ
jgi:hypothetical protein